MTKAIVSLIAPWVSCDRKHAIAMCMLKTSMSLKCYIYIPYVIYRCVMHMRQLCQYICLIWAHCNQRCYQEHCCTHISHYWHMPWASRPPTSNIYVPPHYNFGPHTDTTLLDIQVQQTTNCNFQWPCYFHICVRNKCAPQMSLMPITSCADNRQLYQYMCLILNKFYEKFDQKCWYTCIHIIGICSQTNMSPILYTMLLYVPLHSYCNLHVEPI